MMNLRAMANGVITGVNPDQKAVLRVNTGNAVDDAGRIIPAFTEEPISIQLQSISTADLEHLNLINQQGQFIYAYVSGQLAVIRRAQGKGAEHVIFTAYGEEEASEWMVKQVVESYYTWCKVLLWRQ